MKTYQKLLSTLYKNDILFKNRIVMAPMSRRRVEKGIPNEWMLTYFKQRASAGLIITDNTAVEANGVGYTNVPGIYTKEQKEGWKKVVNAVHAAGGKIFVQLVHAGRIGHPSIQEGRALIAPSAIPVKEKMRIPDGTYQAIPLADELDIIGVHAMIDAHIQAAKNAIEVGFDGVEVHGAHGFLPDQFLNPGANQRKDIYGGNIVNRSRFLLDIMHGIVQAIGKNRVGVRLSPFRSINGLHPYAEESATHRYLIRELNKLDILYIHLSNSIADGRSVIPKEFIEEIRQGFTNLILITGGYTAQRAEQDLQAGIADLIGFGKPFISNPDLVERFRTERALTPWDEETFYYGGPKGYIDYPTIQSMISKQRI
ncbi:alkene reductase [Olivibacter sp. CPCC 100613]|uniref:alkene reductase n=1 Tax=Olivibacter sp. CPCC 100613 TaxID=3079931 RepID=UPI002FF70531